MSKATPLASGQVTAADTPTARRSRDGAVKARADPLTNGRTLYAYTPLQLARSAEHPRDGMGQLPGCTGGPAQGVDGQRVPVSEAAARLGVVGWVASPKPRTRCASSCSASTGVEVRTCVPRLSAAATAESTARSIRRKARSRGAGDTGRAEPRRPAPCAARPSPGRCAGSRRCNRRGDRRSTGHRTG
jgi:hypothetical protein